MAAKKIAGTEEVVEDVKIAQPVRAKKEVDPWTQMVEVKIPKTADGSANYIIASVNGRVFKVMKGVNVKVPAPIAEVLEHSFEAQDEAELFIAGASE